MKKTFYIILVILLSGMSAFSQTDKIETNRGNEALAEGDLPSAITHYQNAIAANPEYKEALFNLGNAYQAQSAMLAKKASELENPEEQQQYTGQMQELAKQAAAEYDKVAELVKSDEELNNTQYNMGNAQLVGGELEKSIEAYKEALRKNPTDEEARYNLAYAKQLKQQQEQQQEQQQDQNQDQEKKEEDKKEQEQKEQDQQQDQQQQEQQPQPQEMSKEEAEQLLEALKKQEKDLQEKLNKKKKPGKRVKIEKDW